MTASENKIYVVHLYREVRVTFSILATSDEDAASRARLLHTDQGDVYDAEGQDLCAIVERDVDDDYIDSHLIVFKEGRLRDAAADLLRVLELALAALNTAQRFAVPSLDTDSYRIARLCDLAIANAKGGAQ